MVEQPPGVKKNRYIRWAAGFACAIVGVAFWQYIFSGLYALCLVGMLLLRLPFAMADAIKLQYFIDHKQLLESARTVLKRKQDSFKKGTSTSAQSLDTDKLPEIIRNLHPTTVAIVGNCLLIERCPVASAYGYFACLPGGKPSGYRASFVQESNKKLDGLWYFATPSK